MFIAGIDGGGTSTRLEIRDADNSFIRRESFGAFNISAIGADAFSARLDEVFAACGDMSGCAALCIGAAGLSLPQTERIIHRQLELAHFRGVLRLCGDHEIALRGAMDGAGCVLIAGTGRYASASTVTAYRRAAADTGIFSTMSAAVTPSGAMPCGRLCAVPTDAANRAR